MMAIQTANALVEIDVASYLCATRSEGQLKAKLKPEVGYICLNRKKTIDVKAIKNLVVFVRKHNINCIHAHSSSFFIGWIIKLFNPSLNLIWHDHYGNSEYLYKRRKRVLKFCSNWFNAIVVVNSKLFKWNSFNLRCDKVVQLNNYPEFEKSDSITKLFGVKDKRIVCVAGFREQKNHLLLLKSFEKVMSFDWTLHLVGNVVDKNYFENMNSYIFQNKLSDKVFVYHNCIDIENILNQSSIGVLSSLSEGLPVSLLEYGLAKLPTVVTNVGEISKVVKHNISGLIVESNDVLSLSNGLKLLIENDDIREKFSQNLHSEIKVKFSKKSYIDKLLKLYVD